MKDLSKRILLTPGKTEELNFKGIRLMGHRCVAGSRLVLVLGVIKEVGREINYGTGKPVSEESIADAKEPVRVRWMANSFIEIPVMR